MNLGKFDRINRKVAILTILVVVTLVNVNSMQLLPERDTVTPQDRNYTVFILPEISYTSVFAESMDYSLSYNYYQNSTHAWVMFSIPESLMIEFRYKVFVYLFNSYGDTIANGTFKFIIADNLSDDQLWDLWDKYAEYEEVIQNQSGIIGEQNETISGLIDDLSDADKPGKPLDEQVLPVIINIFIFLTGALTVSFVAFLGVTKMKRKYKVLKQEHGELEDNFRSEVYQNRSGSMSLLATKPAGDGRPISIIELAEERGAVKMLRDDPQLPDFMQVIEVNEEKSSLEHLKNLFTTDKYGSVYNDKKSYWYHTLNALIRYCENYGYTGEKGTLYPKGCLLADIKEYRDKIHKEIKQYSLAQSYVPAAQEESQLRAKVRGTFKALPEVPKL